MNFRPTYSFANPTEFLLLSWNEYKTSVSILIAKHCLSFRVAVKFCVHVPLSDYTTHCGSWLKGSLCHVGKFGGPILFFRRRPRDVNFAFCILFWSPCNSSDINLNIIPVLLLRANQSSIRYFGCLGCNTVDSARYTLTIKKNVLPPLLRQTIPDENGKFPLKGRHILLELKASPSRTQ